MLKDQLNMVLRLRFDIKCGPLMWWAGPHSKENIYPISHLNVVTTHAQIFFLYTMSVGIRYVKGLVVGAYEEFEMTYWGPLLFVWLQNDNYIISTLLDFGFVSPFSIPFLLFLK